MKKLFTRRFYAASPIDQLLIVDARLRDLEQALPWDDAGRAKRMIRRIKKKAIELELYAKEGDHE